MAILRDLNDTSISLVIIMVAEFISSLEKR
jgi:hypothetical protein